MTEPSGDTGGLAEALRGGALVLAPLTRGGNLPFRRLCAEQGAEVTVSEMAYAQQVARRSRSEIALLRHHPREGCFGVQIAAGRPSDAVRAGEVAVRFGAAFVDLNAGCPIRDTVKRGMGSTLLQRPPKLGRILEALAKELPVPVTVKLRSGWSEQKVNAPEVARVAEESGAAAVALHARTREQRYAKAADWALVARLAGERRIPVVGNGDVLTHYEARDRLARSGCAALMLARGALIKPWLFREIREGRDLDPSAEERVALYRRLAGFMREHFGADAKGRERAMRFLPWHLSFLHRYRPLPESEWAERAREHPLLQTRLPTPPDLPLLERVLRDPREASHERIAGILWESEGDDDAVKRLLALGRAEPPVDAPAGEVKTSHG